MNKTLTCIVGLVRNGKVYLGADSCGSNGSAGLPYKTAKLFRKGDLLFGYTSSYRMGQLLRYRLTLPPRKSGQSFDDWLYSDFIDAVRDCEKDGGYARKDEEVESGGVFLLASIEEGRLFMIQSDFSILESTYPFHAVGCGAHMALGAIYAASTLRSSIGALPALLLGLEAAAAFSVGVCPPFCYVSGKTGFDVRPLP